MRKLNIALKAGKIDQETFNRAVARTKTEFQAAGQASNQAFGGTALAKLQNYATGMFTLQAAGQAFAAAMAYGKQNTDAAMASVEALLEARRELQQMADSGEQYQKFSDFANQLSLRGLKREDATQIISAAEAEGFQGNEDLVARLIAANELTSTSVRTLAGQVPGIFDNKITPIQGVAGGALAGKMSRLTVDELANMLPKAAQGGAISGASPAETMALGATLVKRGERAPEYMSTFASQLATGEYRKQFTGLGVLGSVEKLQSMTEQQRQKMLGTGKETNLTYMWVSQDMALIKSRQAQIQQAMDSAEGYVAGVEAKAFDPSTESGQMMIARRGSIVSSNELQISREKRLATGGYDRRSAVNRGDMRNEEGFGGPISTWAGHQAMSYAEQFSVPSGVVEAAGTIGKFTGLGALEAAGSRLLDASTKLLESAGVLADRTQQQRAAANAQPE